jgi:hypothetical protein
MKSVSQNKTVSVNLEICRDVFDAMPKLYQNAAILLQKEGLVKILDYER